MAEGFGYEIEFLPVGEGEKNGDAIVTRWGEPGSRSIMVVDGGTIDSGKAVVDHIKTYYGNPPLIDVVVCTHPDDDHSSGLREVIKSFDVGAIVIHRPWLYAEQLVSRFKGNWTVDGLRKHLRECFPIIAEVSDYAEENGIELYAPFQGMKIYDYWTVASPSLDMYLDLVPHFSKTPEAALPAQNELSAAFGGLLKAVKEVVKWVSESWNTETLREDDTPTSPSNESSVVLWADFDDQKCLLTGDAGIRALTEVCDYADASGWTLRDFKFSQIPHHGSRHNVSPSVLNRLIGSPVAEGQKIGHSAYASVSKGSTTHPRRVVMNAYTRRGASVNTTSNGNTIRYKHNMDARENWSTLEPEGLFSQVEGD